MIQDALCQRSFIPEGIDRLKRPSVKGHSQVERKTKETRAETERFCVCQCREVRGQRTVKHLGLWFVTMDPELENPLHSSLDVDAQPLKTFIETVTTGGTGSLSRCSWINQSAPGKNVRGSVPG